jgi:membrane protease YdiL (CAAX protease family)
MTKSPAPFWAALGIGWLALGAAGAAYARLKGIPSWSAVPVIGAFLIAYPFYLVPAFPAIRCRLAGRKLPVYLVASAVLPYLVCCLGAVHFEWGGLARLIGLALGLGLWFVVFPRSALTDVTFLAVIPLVLLGGYLTSIYVPVYPKLKDIVFLGHITLDQMAVMALLLKRDVADSGYGFLPSRREWGIGILHFLYFAPVGLALAFLFHLFSFRMASPWLIVPSFFGFMWTVALSEEFFIWGVLQKWLADWTASPTAAMLGSSLCFGLIHIGFRFFPNWGWVVLAGAMGWFCGRARNQAGSIRAGMVTHALVFTAWKTFFA